MKRLCAYFDDESTAIIEKYEKKYGGSTAAILRKALQCLKNNEEAQEKTSWENIIAYVDFLANMEHVILDIAHWKLIFTEIGKGSEKFWEEMRRIGEEHTKEYYDKGLKNIKDILEYVEKTNWYRLSIDSDTSFTLILGIRAVVFLSIAGYSSLVLPLRIVADSIVITICIYSLVILFRKPSEMK